MTVEELRAFYEKNASQSATILKEVSKEISQVSNSRLISAVAFIGVIIFGLSENQDALYFLPFIFIAFVALVRWHSGLFERKVHLENLVKINKLELKSLDGIFSGFAPGTAFVDPHHPYSHDLDIFGEGSLYQYLNRCNTLGGKKLLADRLSQPLSTADAIRLHQQAAAELKDKTAFRQELQARGMQVEELSGDRMQLQEWIRHKSFLFGKPIYRVILAVFPLVTICLLFLAIFLEGFGKFFFLAAALQWIFLGFHLKKVNSFHQYISQKKNILNRYALLLKETERQKFSSPLLQQIYARAHDASRQIARLASLVGGLDARLNSMTSLFANSLVLYDMQFVYRLEEWKEKHAANLEQWMDAVEEMEVLCTMGTFAFNNEKFVFPSVNTSRILVAEGVGHPLIAEDERVLNDITVDGEKSIVIITGANMAGKSTFLRTLGVNVVLALAGAPVCASAFNCPIIAMRSGMRTADSLRDHQSYFYAELNRLKSIVDELKSGKELLILLDEILKGTNSNDKQAGSIALVTQLISYPSLVFVATHDLALGELDRKYPGKVRNFCFEPTIQNDQLSFTYKLQPGIATKMNATFLMRKMGIIPSN